MIQSGSRRSRDSRGSNRCLAIGCLPAGRPGGNLPRDRVRNGRWLREGSEESPDTTRQRAAEKPREAEAKASVDRKCRRKHTASGPQGSGQG